MRNALAQVPEGAAVVLVHDAARPPVSEEVIERVVTGLEEGWDGVAPTLPVSDTVKRVDGEAVAETIDRRARDRADAPGLSRRRSSSRS